MHVCCRCSHPAQASLQTRRRRTPSWPRSFGIRAHGCLSGVGLFSAFCPRPRCCAPSLGSAACNTRALVRPDGSKPRASTCSKQSPPRCRQPPTGTRPHRASPPPRATRRRRSRTAPCVLVPSCGRAATRLAGPCAARASMARTSRPPSRSPRLRDTPSATRSGSVSLSVN
jgi:hypothetical protein